MCSTEELTEERYWEENLDPYVRSDTGAIADVLLLMNDNVLPSELGISIDISVSKYEMDGFQS